MFKDKVLNPRCLVVAILSLVASVPLRAQCDETYLPSGAALHTNSEFGTAVDVGGDFVVIGSPGQDAAPVGATGVVTVARWDGLDWITQLLPMPASVQPGDRFGQAVSINEAGDLIVVGSPFNDSVGLESGAIYLYVLDVFSQTFHLDAEIFGILDFGLFGAAVDITGDVAAVGAPGEVFGAGTVNLFRKTGPATWNHEGLLLGEVSLDGFGWAVALDGNSLVVGAPFHDAPLVDTGKIYVYQFTGTWDYVVSFVENQADAHFGSAVDVHGIQLMAGAPDYDVGPPDSGVVNLFTWNGSAWTDRYRYTTGGSHRMGAAVALTAEYAFAGHPRAPGAFGTSLGIEAGFVSAVRYDGSQWVTSGWEMMWSANDVTDGDHFGSALAVRGNRVIVGSPKMDLRILDTGAALAFDLGLNGTTTDLGFGMAGYNGQTPVLSARGSLCGRTLLTVHLTQAKPFTITFVIAGPTAIYSPYKGGTMVPMPQLIRAFIATDPTGGWDISALWGENLGPLSFYLQVWIPDTNGPKGFAASNGLLLSAYD